MTAGRQYESQVAGESHDNPAHSQGGTKGVKSLLKVLLPLVTLATGGLAALWLLETGPQARPRRGQRNAALVEVEQIRFGPQQTYVTAMGTVIPAREIDLKAQVTGEVREISRNFAPGGEFRQGDWLLRIDPTDYQIVARQLAGDVARAEANLKIEQGNQLIAKREYELLGEAVSDDERDLILRRPQLASTRAALETAKARLEKARLDLSRTTVTSPFNAVVGSRGVDLGTRVTPTTVLARLVGTDAFWIELSVPVDQLEWIRIPANGAEDGAGVRVYNQAAWGPDGFRHGWVIRLAAGLESRGRMAQVLVSVQDPLCLESGSDNGNRMLIGSYVRVQIQGTTLPSAAAVSRAHMREGDTVWIMDPGNRLDIRKVNVVFKDPERVLIADGVQAGERLIVSDLPAAVQEMPLRLPGVPSGEKDRSAGGPPGAGRSREGAP